MGNGQRPIAVVDVDIVHGSVQIIFPGVRKCYANESFLVHGIGVDRTAPDNFVFIKVPAWSVSFHGFIIWVPHGFDEKDNVDM